MALRYLVVVANNPKDLSDKVNAHMDEGYEPYHGLNTSPTRGEFIQVMMKPKTIKRAPKPQKEKAA